jgi:hypothetical protein
MGILDKYISLIGFLCYTMPCGQVGIVFLLIFLKEMPMIRGEEKSLLSNTQKCIRQAKSISISPSKSFGNGLFWRFGTALSPFLEPSMLLATQSHQMGTSKGIGISRQFPSL